jgi:hypothetical protein
LLDLGGLGTPVVIVTSSLASDKSPSFPIAFECKVLVSAKIPVTA